VNLKVAPRPVSDSTQMLPPLTFNYLPAECESNTGTGNFLSVETLEHAEYELGVIWINTDAIISHREQPPFCGSLCGNVDCAGSTVGAWTQICIVQTGSFQSFHLDKEKECHNRRQYMHREYWRQIL
jgi:hypothetical protein